MAGPVRMYSNAHFPDTFLFNTVSVVGLWFHHPVGMKGMLSAYEKMIFIDSPQKLQFYEE